MDYHNLVKIYVFLGLAASGLFNTLRLRNPILAVLSTFLFVLLSPFLIDRRHPITPCITEPPFVLCFAFVAAFMVISGAIRKWPAPLRWIRSPQDH